MDDLPLHLFPATFTDRLSLRPLQASDASVLQRLTDEPAITDNVIFLASPFTLADAKQLIACNNRENCFLGIWAGEALAGVFGLHLRGATQLEIGYWIGTAFHRQGYATEAARAAITQVRKCYADRQIIAECREANTASWNLLHKLGFRPNGERGERPGRALLVLASTSDL